MSNLKHWQDKIKEKRKSTPFRKYLKEIVSFATFNFQKNSGMVSKFPQTDRVKKVIDYKEFSNNSDDLIKNGLDYDFSKTIFGNYKNLQDSIDLFNVVIYGDCENSDFSDMVLNSKNIYISSTVITNCENILYSLSVKDNCINVFNSMAVWEDSENIYFTSGVQKSFKIFYSKFINNSNNIYFSTNLNGCSECVFCSDLDNCSYYIKNKKYSKQEYFKEKEKVLKEKNKFLNYYKNLEKIGKNINSNDSKGSAIFNSEEVNNGFFTYNLKKANNVMFVGGKGGDENMYDTFTGGSPTAHNFYGVMGANGDNLYNCISITFSSNCYYSSKLTGCSFCIGCIGLKNKSYCILNKQYTKEEWEILSDKIFKQMEDDGILGDFFPGELNPFYFNDTVAGLIGNFTKEEVEADGYMWRDEEVKVDIPEGSSIIQTRNLGDYQGFDSNGVWKINPEILKKVIKDKVNSKGREGTLGYDKGNYYRIVKMEYDFLVKHGLPLPEIHWMDRMKLNFGV